MKREMDIKADIVDSLIMDGKPALDGRNRVFNEGKKLQSDS